MTQIIFDTDSSLHALAKQKLKQDGMTLKTFFTYCMKEYINGNLGMTITYKQPEFTRPPLNETIQELEKNKQFLSSLSS